MLAPAGSLYLFAGPRMARGVANVIAEHFEVLNEIVWVKRTGHHLGARKVALRSYFPQTERILFAQPRGADAAYQAAVRRLRAEAFEPIRAYLDGERERAGLRMVDCDRALGSQMATHYFGRSQWTMPTRDAYEALRATFNASAPDGPRLLAIDYGALEERYRACVADYERRRAATLELRRPFHVTAQVPYTDVWTFDPVQHYPGKHPCEKPLSMLGHIVAASSRPGQRVVDFFAGSGTTGEAAVSQGRDVVLVELSPRWAGGRRAIAASERGLGWSWRRPRRDAGFRWARCLGGVTGGPVANSALIDVAPYAYGEAVSSARRARSTTAALMLAGDCTSGG